jgi:prepilin-type N-terminal cleavage/methylation domain-containing protein
MRRDCPNGSRRTAAGFSLAELAIAMVIIALLLASAFIPLSTQMDLRAISDTQRTMDGIKEALIGYAQANGRLPCPALATTPTGSGGAGVEQINTSPAGNPTNVVTGFPYSPCTYSIGVLPWVTLGVPETDAWGRRFTYRVVGTYADGVKTNPANLVNTAQAADGDSNTANQSINCTAPSPAPTQASFAMCTRGDLTVSTRSTSTRAMATLASEIPVVIVSHGKNGYGAYTPDGLIIGGLSGTDEPLNTVSGNAKNFISREHSPFASSCSDTTIGQSFCEFDDVVAWISPSTLIARMVNAGRLP